MHKVRTCAWREASLRIPGRAGVRRYHRWPMADDQPEPGFNGKGILSGPIDLDGGRARPVYPKVPAVPGLAVEQRGTGLRGVVVALGKGIV